ncbi:hypothetical protein HR45_18795 [Shewanella mangrovi]|uniref:Iron dicitrate transport regulator FecR n=1 Tax=Shewanella mangrovi TaxID=1515746 RepID=A0A094JD74_9GAMM|nr:FecR family protein [Shewanella mangrovi]KFZ35999.1 hypothetical protein HR45_18795 [Shewanella mangrovi]
MSQVIKFSPKTEIKQVRRQASEWIAKLDSESLTDAEQQNLRQWLTANPLHQQELLRLARLWDKLDDIGALLTSPLTVSPVSSGSQTTEANRNPAKFHQYRAQIAAAFLALLLIPLAVFGYKFTSMISTNGEYRTAIGVQKHITLSDGSVIVLNTNSRLKIDFSFNRRALTLVSGEANFDVAPDKTRPFVVKVGKGDVRALGTSFAVRKEGSKINVLVAHGTVRVNATDTAKASDSVLPADTSRESVVVTAGKQVVVDNAIVESVSQPSAEQLANSLYWKKGFLAFDDEKLVNVISEVSRYTNLKIVIGDPALRDIRVGGFYPIDNLDTVFTAMQMNLGLKIKKLGDTSYYITKS